MENLWNFPKGIFQRNGYLTLFIDMCFEKFLDRLHIIKTTSETVENQPSYYLIWGRLLYRSEPK